jgi:hypothetical protein
MAITPRMVPVGRGSLLMTSEEFLNGYQAGHLAYMTEARAVAFSDERLRTLIMDKLESMDDSERYNVGYVVGWIVSLACKGTKGVLQG